LIQIPLARVRTHTTNRSEQAMMGLDNPIHILFLLVLLLLVFGAKRLPEMGRSLGDGLRGFKESISGETPTVHAEQAHIARAPEPVAHATQPAADRETVGPVA
jgi:sec-independent protein translocase protein TatA